MRAELDPAARLQDEVDPGGVEPSRGAGGGELANRASIACASRHCASSAGVCRAFCSAVRGSYSSMSSIRRPRAGAGPIVRRGEVLGGARAGVVDELLALGGERASQLLQDQGGQIEIESHCAFADALPQRARVAAKLASGW